MPPWLIPETTTPFLQLAEDREQTVAMALVALVTSNIPWVRGVYSLQVWTVSVLLYCTLTAMKPR
jgi:hypothetical protein